MRTKGHIFQDLDWLLVGLYLLMVFIGWISIYAATFDEEHRLINDLSSNHGKQLLWIGLAIVLAVTILLLDQRFFEVFGYVVFGISLLLLAAVLVAGSEIKGSQSWFVLGPVSFQPSELAKYGCALALAKLLRDPQNGYDKPRIRLLAFATIAAPMVLIMGQPDVGSTLVFLAFSLVLYREGLSGWWFLLGSLAAALFIAALYMKQVSIAVAGDFVASGAQLFMVGITATAALVYYLLRKRKGSLLAVLAAYFSMSAFFLSVGFLFDAVLKPHHQNRINELLGIVSDPQGAGYNVHQSKIAIGSGGFWGKGFLEGTQTRFDFVPEQSTDFIFCTVGEEWGFVGSLLVVLLFVVLIGRLVWLAEKQRSRFTRIYGYCVAAIVFIHFAINIGMTIGLAPVIGIPLPFFSYGGSSLWSFTVLLFTFIKLDSERKYVLR